MLGQQDLAATSIDGYAREEPTHLAVAAAIASGRADAGLGIMAAAQPFGLGFVPLVTEPYHLAVAPGALESPQLAPLWELLRSDRFKASVEDWRLLHQGNGLSSALTLAQTRCGRQAPGGVSRGKDTPPALAGPLATGRR